MDINLTVVPSKRGLDTDQVDAALAEVQVEVARLESNRADVDKRIDTLTREIAEVRSALKRATAKPSFSDLGAAFEQTLRVAEEQASKLITDAQAESSATRRAAEDDAKALTENAQKQAKKLVEDAQNRASSTREDAINKNESALKAARNTLENAEKQYAQAEIMAASIAEEGQHKRKVLEAELAQELDDSRGEMITLRQLHEREQLRIKDEIESSRLKAERESERLASENEAYIQPLLEDSQLKLDETRRRARALIIETQSNYGQAREQAVSLVREAREKSSTIIRRARERAELLNDRIVERTNDILTSTEAMVDELYSERESVEAFNSEIRIISMSDIASDEAVATSAYDALADSEELSLDVLGMNDEELMSSRDEK